MRAKLESEGGEVPCRLHCISDALVPETIWVGKKLRCYASAAADERAAFHELVLQLGLVQYRKRAMRRRVHTQV